MLRLSRCRKAAWQDAKQEPPLLYQIPEAARRLGISRSMIYELVWAGELHFIKLGRRSLIREEELQTFLARKADEAEGRA
jgi:excisionase family DNA binding protein